MLDENNHLLDTTFFQGISSFPRSHKPVHFHSVAAYIAPVKRDIRSVTMPELQVRFTDWQQPSYRVSQVLDWVYVRRVTSWEAMTNLPKSLRQQLAETYEFHSLQLVRKQGARDTTQKFLWRLNDASMIESVLIPANPALYGEASDRHTLCVSTQVGCAYGCRFCASGLEGWKRNLNVEEIIEQVLATERWATTAESTEERIVNNLVIMGMGEPLANYDNLLNALRILNAPWGGKIGARKITISTSGLVPQIRKLADDPLQFRLAISLHGATDEVRNKIMPVNKKYPLEELTAACEYYQDKKGRMITLEYILIAGVNDNLDQVKPLAQLAHKLHAKVNLIPYNKVEDLPWERPDEATQEAFLNALENERITATLRREKGHDIDAACGQLRLKTERELITAGL
jgi:23S rRNA (adenine2503-C2)-methyltransferase